MQLLLKYLLFRQPRYHLGSRHNLHSIIIFQTDRIIKQHEIFFSTANENAWGFKKRGSRMNIKIWFIGRFSPRGKIENVLKLRYIFYRSRSGRFLKAIQIT